MQKKLKVVKALFTYAVVLTTVMSQVTVFAAAENGNTGQNVSVNGTMETEWNEDEDVVSEAVSEGETVPEADSSEAVSEGETVESTTDAADVIEEMTEEVTEETTQAAEYLLMTFANNMTKNAGDAYELDQNVYSDVVLTKTFPEKFTYENAEYNTSEETVLATLPATGYVKLVNTADVSRSKSYTVDINWCFPNDEHLEPTEFLDYNIFGEVTYKGSNKISYGGKNFTLPVIFRTLTVTPKIGEDVRKDLDRYIKSFEANFDLIERMYTKESVNAWLNVKNKAKKVLENPSASSADIQKVYLELKTATEQFVFRYSVYVTANSNRNLGKPDFVLSWDKYEGAYEYLYEVIYMYDTIATGRVQTLSVDISSKELEEGGNYKFRVFPFNKEGDAIVAYKDQIVTYHGTPFEYSASRSGSSITANWYYWPGTVKYGVYVSTKEGSIPAADKYPIYVNLTDKQKAVGQKLTYKADGLDANKAYYMTVCLIDASGKSIAVDTKKINANGTTSGGSTGGGNTGSAGASGGGSTGGGAGVGGSTGVAGGSSASGPASAAGQLNAMDMTTLKNEIFLQAADGSVSKGIEAVSNAIKETVITAIAEAAALNGKAIATFDLSTAPVLPAAVMNEFITTGESVTLNCVVSKDYGFTFDSSSFANFEGDVDLRMGVSKNDNVGGYKACILSAATVVPFNGTAIMHCNLDPDMAGKTAFVYQMDATGAYVLYATPVIAEGGNISYPISAIENAIILY